MRHAKPRVMHLLRFEPTRGFYGYRSSVSPVSAFFKSAERKSYKFGRSDRCDAYHVGALAFWVQAGFLRAYRVDRGGNGEGSYIDRFWSLRVGRVGSELVLIPNGGKYVV